LCRKYQKAIWAMESAPSEVWRNIVLIIYKLFKQDGSFLPDVQVIRQQSDNFLQVRTKTKTTDAS
jgi:hypothetical protein